MTHQAPGRLLMVTREQEADRRYGLGKSLQPLIEQLCAAGWEVNYLCRPDITEQQHQGLLRWLERFGRLPFIASRPHRRALLDAWGERLTMGWLAARFARREGVDYVHLHDPWIAIGYWIARQYYGLWKVRWGITEHGFGCYSRATHEDGLLQGERAQRVLRRIESAILQRADWVITPTAAAMRQLCEDLGCSATPDHWCVIPHPRPAIPQISREDACRRLGLAADNIYVLGVGRLAPLKRFPLLIDACAVLAERFPRMQLLLLGDGDRAALQQQAERLGFSERLQMSVTDDMACWLRAADLYVSCSATESFGLANLEALTAGIPSICTAVGGVPDVVGTGAMLIAADASDLPEALERLLSQESLRRELEQKALAWTAAWPDPAAVMERYVELYTNT